jgi:hypothetical protein
MFDLRYPIYELQDVPVSRGARGVFKIYGMRFMIFEVKTSIPTLRYKIQC